MSFTSDVSFPVTKAFCEKNNIKVKQNTETYLL